MTFSQCGQNSDRILPLCCVVCVEKAVVAERCEHPEVGPSQQDGMLDPDTHTKNHSSLYPLAIVAPAQPPNLPSPTMSFFSSLSLPVLFTSSSSSSSCPPFPAASTGQACPSS